MGAKIIPRGVVEGAKRDAYLLYVRAEEVVGVGGFIPEVNGSAGVLSRVQNHLLSQLWLVRSTTGEDLEFLTSCIQSPKRM